MIAILLATLFNILPASSVPAGSVPPACTINFGDQQQAYATGQDLTFGQDTVMVCWYGQWYVATSTKVGGQ